tara:strand:+ start:3868 stop:4077 length:210 start_codon:yes stop_codon:yes gene_type:complete
LEKEKRECGTRKGEMEEEKERSQKREIEYYKYGRENVRFSFKFFRKVRHSFDCVNDIITLGSGLSDDSL